MRRILKTIGEVAGYVVAVAAILGVILRGFGWLYAGGTVVLRIPGVSPITLSHSDPAIPPALPAENLAKNPDFSIPAGISRHTELTGQRSGEAAAAYWNVVNNNNASTTTDLVGSKHVHAPDKNMLSVCTTGPKNGVAQRFGEGAPNGARASAWVYLTTGSMGTALMGDSDQTVATVADNAVGRWYPLTTSHAGPTTEIVFYSTGAERTCFSLDNVSVAPSH
jgi:hypothetical protein